MMFSTFGIIDAGVVFLVLKHYFKNVTSVEDNGIDVFKE
jgi:hypothetical protein